MGLYSLYEDKLVCTSLEFILFPRNTVTHTVLVELCFVFVLIEEEKGRLFLNRVKS